MTTDEQSEPSDAGFGRFHSARGGFKSDPPPRGDPGPRTALATWTLLKSSGNASAASCAMRRLAFASWVSRTPAASLETCNFIMMDRSWHTLSTL
jgi:hypothetical protein